MVELKFPSLEFIKSHPLHPVKGDFEEYSWTIFGIDHSPIFCRITYNENDNGKLYLDMIVNGYSDHWVPDGFGKTYPVTKAGYEELKKVSNREVNRIIDSIVSSNELCSSCWEEEN